MLLYVVYDKGLKMIDRDEDDIVQVTEEADFEEIGTISFEEAKIVPFFKVRK
jgi:hypothetical protein